MGWTRNRVTLFSNGIALFERTLAVSSKKPEVISLPVKRDRIGDLLGSFSVRGNVTLSKPLSYTPTDNQGNKIGYDPNAVTNSLGRSLAGMKVRLQLVDGKSAKGTLLGLDTGEGEASNESSYVIQDRKGRIRRIAVGDVESTSFKDAAAAAEVKRALEQLSSGIRDEAITVKCELTAAQDGEATLVYTQPAPAWKISYRFHRLESGKIILQAFAVVDNNSAEDWDDFSVTVVTGDPIHYDTNIAEVVVPARQKVNVVNGRASGPVTAASTEMRRAKRADRAMAFSAAPQMASEGGLESLGGATPNGGGQLADFAGLAQSESGDFTSYTSQEGISIAAGASGLVPLFETTLDDASAVLFYDPHKDQERPWQAVRFKAPQNLGFGDCIVFNADSQTGFAGQALLTACKTGEERLLVHARDNRVRVRQEYGQRESQCVRISFGAGTVVTETRTRAPFTYHIENLSDEAFELVLDYPRQLGNSSVACDQDNVSVENLATGGVRVTAQIEAGASTAVNLLETSRTDQNIAIGGNNDYGMNWIQQNLIAVNHPLTQRRDLKPCLDISRQRAEKQQQISDAQTLTSELTEKRTRLCENLAAIRGTSGQEQQANSWAASLVAVEKEIEEQQTLQKGLKRELDGLKVKLQQTLSGLTTAWKFEE